MLPRKGSGAYVSELDFDNDDGNDDANDSEMVGKRTTIHSIGELATKN